MSGNDGLGVRLLGVRIRLMRVTMCEGIAVGTPLAAPVVGTGVFIGAVADIRGENQATAPLFCLRGSAMIGLRK